MKKVIVIGAGLGGLSAAIDLASRGYDVHVIEAFSSAGGKAGTVEIDGRTFDTGPSVLTLPDVFDELFSLTGRRLQDVVSLTSPFPAFRYVFPSGTKLDVYDRIGETIDSVLATYGSEDAGQFADFLDYAGDIWNAARPSFVYGDAPQFSTLLRRGLKTLGEVSSIDPFNTMKRAIDKRVDNPELQALLLRYATYNGSDPRRAPATLNCIAHVELALGGHGVEGGMSALVAALVEAATKLGVVFSYQLPIERIVTKRQRIVGVEHAMGFEAADAVVANADASHVFEDLIAGPRNANEEERSMSGWTGIIRTRRQHDRRAHTVLFPKTYLDEFEHIFDRRRPPDDPTVYACAPSINHAHPGWPEDEGLFVMVNAPAVRAGVEHDFERIARVAKTKLFENGLVEAHDEFRWIRTPRGLASRFFGSRGSLYGAASNGPTAAFKRPANRITRYPGLYLASGSAHPGGGMPLAILSGRAAARALAEDIPCRQLSRSS